MSKLQKQGRFRTIQKQGRFRTKIGKMSANMGVTRKGRYPN